MEIKTCVVGAGQMGNGIAHVSALAGLKVVMHDIEDAFVQKGLKTVDKNLQRGVDKGKITAEDKQAVLERIQGTTSLNDLGGCDFVVEAIVESLEPKIGTFGTLDGKKVTRETQTWVASLTKLMTGTLMMLFVDQGLVGLDDPVKKFLPEFDREVATDLTIRHLFTHTNGFSARGTWGGDRNPSLENVIGQYLPYLLGKSDHEAHHHLRCAFELLA